MDDPVGSVTSKPLGIATASEVEVGVQIDIAGRTGLSEGLCVSPNWRQVAIGVALIIELIAHDVKAFWVNQVATGIEPEGAGAGEILHSVSRWSGR